MTLNLNCNTTVYYTGNDVQTDFLYSFEIIKNTDLTVAFYNEDKTEWEEVFRGNDTYGWSIQDSPDGSVVRFITPPPNGQELVIFRLTKTKPAIATFSPGHPIKASDLNDNFEQALFAIEDNRCIIEGQLSNDERKYWKKADETVYKPDGWLSDNQHVASTAAIDDRILGLQVDILDDINDIKDDIDDIKDDIKDINVNIDNINIEIDNIEDDVSDIKDDISDINTDLSSKVDKDKGYTDQDIDEGKYTSDDEHFAYTDALTRLYDVTFLEDGQSAPDGAIKYIHPGKWMITSSNQLFMWNGSSWFMPIAGGGGAGGGGAHTTITTTNPINQGYDPATNNYSLTFNINSLNTVPTTRTIRR